jgi:hypothetical protein
VAPLGRSVETVWSIILRAVRTVGELDGEEEGELVGEEVGFEVVGELDGEEVVGERVGFDVGERVGFAVFFNVRVLGRTSTVPMPFNKLENV